MARDNINAVYFVDMAADNTAWLPPLVSGQTTKHAWFARIFLNSKRDCLLRGTGIVKIKSCTSQDHVFIFPSLDWTSRRSGEGRGDEGGFSLANTYFIFFWTTSGLLKGSFNPPWLSTLINTNIAVRSQSQPTNTTASHRSLLPGPGVHTTEWLCTTETWRIMKCVSVY